ncbi:MULTISPECIES: proton-conducting transporter membrane subunit [unclassified Synechococcus]|uniref:proton-conducting transporter transmembrane domain-containing protein n=1 Tax=unclassified Synechococcus TaxID=2626047 RepID=UPI001E581A8E|nr:MULTISPECIES: proton-conducting transporter membrane subunit [unclassified Synechococcus]MEA5423414.1 proton-conducting transporter membrane subunit [Synechococcus sp. CCY9202]
MIAALSPETILTAWLLLPFLAAFLAALLPALARWLALGCVLATAAIAAAIGLQAMPATLLLLGPEGVALAPDALAVPFLLLNALVCGAVLLDGWQRPSTGPFLLLMMVLQGGLNSAFVSVDLISLYVCLEVVGVSAFLLVLTSRSDRCLWVGLRYLLIGNTVMTLYLIGAAVIYLQQGSFRFEAVALTSGGGALALLLVGLFTKSGLFLSGLWLPRTHAESPAEVSALLSGVVVAGGLCPLVRLMDVVPSLSAVMVPIGLASAALGILFALVETDAKRLLAWSTLSQVGFVVLVPAAAGLYALAHGLAKATLFLLARRFPSRQLLGWVSRPLPAAVAWPLWIASLSIVGAPPLLGYLAKQQLDEAIAGPTALVTTVLMVGTAAVYVRLWGTPLSAALPHDPAAPDAALEQARSGASWSAGVVLLLAALLLLTVLLPIAGWGGSASLVGSTASMADLSSSILKGAAKTALVLLAALIVHRTLEPLRRLGQLRLPDLERFQDLVGSVGIVGASLMVALQP